MQTEKLSELRRRAEALAKTSNDAVPSSTLEEARLLIHELLAGLAELEQQNEDLRRTRKEPLASHVKHTEFDSLAPEVVAKLTKSENSLARAQMIAHVGDWEWDISTNKVYWSDELYRIYGFAPHTVDPDYGLVLAQMHPANKDEFLQAIDAALKQDKPFEMDYWFFRKDGSEAILHTIGQVVRNEAGEPVQMFGIVQDITERKQVERALQESEIKLRGILDNIPDLVWLKDLESRFLVVNESFGLACGHRPENLRGKTDLDVWPHELAERYRQDDFEVVDMGVRKQVVEPLPAENGQTRWIETIKTPIRNESGAVIGTAGIARDVTERKIAEAELKHSYEVNKTILNTMNDAVCLINIDDYSIVDANKTFLEQYGPLKEIIGRRCYEITHHRQEPCCPPGDICPLKETVREGRTVYAEHLHFLPDGAKSFAEIITSPVMDESGKVRQIIHIARDITERKRAEAEKAELETYLRQAYKMEAIGTMAGGIAHDFNNILAIIIGATEMALDESPAENQVRYYNEQVLKAAHRAKGLIKQILTFSRQAVQELVPLKPHLIIKEYLKLVRSTIPSTVAIRQNIDPDCGYIDADPTQIHQVIMNLCTNAVYAMDEKGVLEVGLQEIDLKAKALIHKPKLLPGPYACLSVTDTGCGMDQKTMAKIFDPFFTTKKIGEGTGMGLAVVHGIVEAHRGMITVESEPGQGTTFYVFFPISQSETYIEKSKTTEPLPAGTERILFVDDEINLTITLGRILESRGYRVTAKTDSLDALATFQSSPDAFDLVITDQTMPNMSGTELAAELMKIRPDLPIILCTGFSHKVSEENVLAMGIKELCLKPLDKEKLVTVVRKVLDQDKV